MNENIDPGILSQHELAFEPIHKDITLQFNAIIKQFKLKPDFVILGLDAAQAVKQYALARKISPINNQSNPVEDLLKRNFGLTPIIAENLPRYFVQVVVPLDVYY